ncbi:MAG: D-tyrosyl-tRNA(Tyr) deacylase [Acidimicrobiia bacterium]|nr:D-tyrosyl-tRNA(Tyr) deacylase [Acidimicrobiia bacterium]
MKAIVQRVSMATVTVDGDTVGEIGVGLMVLVGVGHDDGPTDSVALAAKLAGLRVFPDDEGRMNLSVVDVGGAVLVVSQFTLHGDMRRGKRPSFTDAAPPDLAEPLVEQVASELDGLGVPVATGRFGARMEVTLVNDGPVTLVIEVRDGRVV